MPSDEITSLALPGPKEHAQWLRNRRKQLLRLLGGPPSEEPARGRTVERREEKTRIVEKVTFEGEAGEEIPAALLIPRNPPLPRPAIICLHSQGPDKKKGKSEVVSGEGVGVELSRRGYLVLAPEAPGYEERREAEEGLECGRLLLQGWSLPAKAAWEVSRAIEYLSSRPELNGERIGLLGLGKGGMIGWLAAAVEPRISTAVICWGASTYASILAGNVSLGPMGWIPGLLNWGDVPEVCCLIAPRPLYFCAAQQDPLFPFGGFQEVFWRVKQLYTRLGEAEKIEQYAFLGPPRWDKETRARIANWFDRWL